MSNVSEDEFDCNEADQIWSKVKNYDQVLETNILFIEGKINCTPYHKGPLELDSQPLKNDLISLHQYRLLTFGGQSGIITESKWIPKWKRGSLKGGKYFLQTRQKAYIEFAMEKTFFNKKFLEKISCDPELVWVIVDNEDSKWEKNFYTNTFVSSYSITEERTSKSLLSIETEEWKKYTKLAVEPISLYIKCLKDLPMWCLCIAFKRWGKEGLEKHLLAMLQ